MGWQTQYRRRSRKSGKIEYMKKRNIQVRMVLGERIKVKTKEEDIFSLTTGSS